MHLKSGLVVASALAVWQTPAMAQQTCPATKGGELPLKYAAKPTVAAITPCDLMTRLYIFADDSMMGRRIGTPDIIRATKYLGDELARLGLKPGGENGTFYQTLPLTLRTFDSAGSTIVANGQTFHGGTDFSATSSAATWTNNAGFVYGGVAADTTSPALSADAVRGKVLVVRAPAIQPQNGPRNIRIGGNQAPLSPAAQAYRAMTTAAAAVITIPATPQGGSPGRGGNFGGGGAIGGRATFNDPAQQGGRGGPGGGAGAVTITSNSRVAEAIFGQPLDQIAKGATAAGSVTVQYKEEAAGGRNVVAILPGSDPKLRGEYVAFGAHPDHNGYFHNPVDTDSLHAWLHVFKPQGADNRVPLPVTDERTKQFRAALDSIRKLRPNIRLDSIQNGADDDGSGSVTMLEIAQKFASLPVAQRPKRSLIFVWNAGEEAGLWGSQYFTNHPTIPRDSIVAQLNMDMVGRGKATDVTGITKDSALIYGGKGYLQLVGSRRLSTELGDIVEQVNKDTKAGFNFDYAIDANGHPSNIYCRSDHANYARYGIPVTFFTTGGHSDYHQLSDEPQYINYTHMAEIGNLVYNIGTKVANLDHRVVVDKEKPASPFAACKQ
jgi:hypothetical protein